METLLHLLSKFSLADIFDILIVAFLIYNFLLLIKETKAYQMTIGLFIIGFAYIISKLINLRAFNWLIRNFIPYLIFALIVLYQAEIRKFLADIGSKKLFRPFVPKPSEKSIKEISAAVEYLSSQRIGALIGIEREISLKSFAEKGIPINANISKDLIVNIFYPRTPLHDGAIIIQKNKITAAGCLLPFPSHHSYGEELKIKTRHLAAIGLSQETDAIVVVVSEENGSISLASRGNLIRNLTRDELEERMIKLIGIE
ncbi:MAG: diadenylate cyclase CdaA [Acidobacteriota bacterium]